MIIFIRLSFIQIDFEMSKFADLLSEFNNGKAQREIKREIEIEKLRKREKEIFYIKIFQLIWHLFEYVAKTNLFFNEQN